MANTAVKGIQPYAVKGGGSITYRRGRVLTNNTTAIFLYDTVIRVATGDYTVQATGTTLSQGSANGCVYTDAAGTRREAKFLPAATLYTSTGVAPDNASYVYLVDNLVNTSFRASVDAAIALTDLNLNYAVTLTAGSLTTGLSGFELTATGRAVTATIPFRVEQFIIGDPLVDVDAAHASVICYANCTADEPALSASLGV